VTADQRVVALEDLLRLRTPLAKAQERLRGSDWDSDEELVALTRADLVRVLDQYLVNKLSAQDVESWANAVEGRDDVGLEGGFEALLKATVFQLANPRLTSHLTSAAAEGLRKQLTSTGRA
jgi:hypothetical protein